MAQATDTLKDTATLEVRGLRVEVQGKEILKGIDLVVPQGEVHAIMGPNGSGKSTLANVIMGRPGYTVTAGEVLFKGQSIMSLKPDQRAQLGLFLAFQYPTEIPGVSVVNFLRSAYNAVKGDQISALAFRKRMKEKMTMLGVEDAMVARYVNQGFSGGEKKKNEILQLAVLEPEIAILDETDSGLDIDSLKAVANGIQQLIGPNLGVLLITHYQRILNYITPDRIHVMMDGRIVLSGGPELAVRLEQQGYEGVRKELGIELERAGDKTAKGETRGKGNRDDAARARRRTDTQGLPDPGANDAREASGLPGQRQHQPEAAPGDRHDQRVLRAPQRQPLSRGVRVGGRGHSQVRGCARPARSVHRSAGPLLHRVQPWDDRVHQPGGARVWPQVPPRGRRDPSVAGRAPLERRPLAAVRPGHRSEAPLHRARR